MNCTDAGVYFSHPIAFNMKYIMAEIMVVGIKQTIGFKYPNWGLIIHKIIKCKI